MRRQSHMDGARIGVDNVLSHHARVVHLWILLFQQDQGWGGHTAAPGGPNGCVLVALDTEGTSGCGGLQHGHCDGHVYHNRFLESLGVCFLPPAIA